MSLLLWMELRSLNENRQRQKQSRQADDALAAKDWAERDSFPPIDPGYEVELPWYARGTHGFMRLSLGSRPTGYQADSSPMAVLLNFVDCPPACTVDLQWAGCDAFYNPTNGVNVLEVDSPVASRLLDPRKHLLQKASRRARIHPSVSRENRVFAIFHDSNAITRPSRKSFTPNSELGRKLFVRVSYVECGITRELGAVQFNLNCANRTRNLDVLLPDFWVADEQRTFGTQIKTLSWTLQGPKVAREAVNV